MKVWKGESNLHELVSQDEEVTSKLSKDEIDECFDVNKHIKHAETIIERVISS